MKKIILPLLLWVNVASSQKLHAYLFCNTDDGAIGYGVKKDYEHMYELCKQIATAMKLRLVNHSLTGTDFNYNKLQETLKEVSKRVSKNDVVVLYFSTHGFKSFEDADSFPRVLIPNPQHIISSQKIYDGIAKYKPKTLLALIDACSEFIPLSEQDSFLLTTSLTQPLPNTDEEQDISNSKNLNYFTLFNNCTQIIVCAGEPGKTTYTTSEGSYFTTSFISALNETVNQKNGWFSWRKILEQARVYTYSKTRGKRSEYAPIWSLNTCEEDKTKHIKIRDYPGNSDYGFSGGIEIVTHESSKKGNYEVTLHPTAKEPIDSVIFFLGYRMSKPIVTLRRTDSVKILFDDHDTFLPKTFDTPVLRDTNFNYKLLVFEEFGVKVKIFCSSGNRYEAFAAIIFPEKEKYTGFNKKSVLISVAVVILVCSALIIVKRRKFFS